jgi:hypothetical protein
MGARFQTLHPDSNKQGTTIDEGKYNQIKQAILSVLEMAGEMPFKDLPVAVEGALNSPFDGSISWYVITVKLDLEARGYIERIPNARPQRLRLTSTLE